MPIAPITGKLRKRLWLDLTTAAGLGTFAAYGYWFVVLPLLNGTGRSFCTRSLCTAYSHKVAYHAL
jgi:hypothetical protein